MEVDEVTSICTNLDEWVRVKNRPWVTLTFAQSIDGSITATSGRSHICSFANCVEGAPLALSCEQSLKLTHQLRAAHEGILLGINTLRIDNPSLTVRYGIEGNNPKPIIVDSQLNCPLDCKLLNSTECVKPMIVTIPISEDDAEKKKRATELKSLGAELLICTEDNGRVDLSNMLEQLLSVYHLKSVMVEGGAQIIQSFLSRKQQIIDSVVITISPQFVGGVKAVQQLLPEDNRNWYKAKRVKYVQKGDDIVLYQHFC